MNHEPDAPSFWGSRAGLALLVVFTVGGFYLLSEHRAHLFGILPYLFLLACPLMHRFMHHGHGPGRTRPHEQPGGDDGQQRRQ